MQQKIILFSSILDEKGWQRKDIGGFKRTSFDVKVDQELEEEGGDADDGEHEEVGDQEGASSILQMITMTTMITMMMMTMMITL